MELEPVEGSFRDPSGFVFRSDGVIYRQVNPCYAGDYERLMESGLYDRLVADRLLVAHAEVAVRAPGQSGAFKVLQPEPIDFISFPYEWCFSQFKAAALATLTIQRLSLEHGLVLKDASAFNVQFCGARPVFIDTLSFATYVEGEPWVAYQQFCQQFLAPLALMSMTDVRLGRLSQLFIDGVALDLASSLLPWRSRLKLGLLLHLHLHARQQRTHGDGATRAAAGRRVKVTKNGLIGILDMLDSTIRSLQWRPAGTEWAEYYSATNYSDEATQAKETLVSSLIRQAAPERVWDLGANTGAYSRVARDCGARVVSFDVDPAAVERNFLHCEASEETDILPLVLDLTNPTPAIGWANGERPSVIDRGPVDLVMALALLHHLALSNNTPLTRIAALLANMARFAIVEFVPKEDSQVQRLLRTRSDIFPDYTEEGFERAFDALFQVERKEPVGDSRRTLYLLRRRD